MFTMCTSGLRTLRASLETDNDWGSCVVPASDLKSTLLLTAKAGPRVAPSTMFARLVSSPISEQERSSGSCVLLCQKDTLHRHVTQHPSLWETVKVQWNRHFGRFGVAHEMILFAPPSASACEAASAVFCFQRSDTSRKPMVLTGDFGKPDFAPPASEVIASLCSCVCSRVLDCERTQAQSESCSCSCSSRVMCRLSCLQHVFT